MLSSCHTLQGDGGSRQKLALGVLALVIKLKACPPRMHQLRL